MLMVSLIMSDSNKTLKKKKKAISTQQLFIHKVIIQTTSAFMSKGYNLDSVS